jgi:Icc-related predicted phosphoesterase
VIKELSGLSNRARLEKIQALGDDAAQHIKRILPEALSSFQHIVVVTHVPPFQESAWWMGKPSAPDWLPFFSCKAVGDVLKESMLNYPTRQMAVLCGHTHGSGRVQILPNLTILSGSARYGHPRIQKVFDWK